MRCANDYLHPPAKRKACPKKYPSPPALQVFSPNRRRQSRKARDRPVGQNEIFMPAHLASPRCNHQGQRARPELGRRPAESMAEVSKNRAHPRPTISRFDEGNGRVPSYGGLAPFLACAGDAKPWRSPGYSMLMSRAGPERLGVLFLGRRCQPPWRWSPARLSSSANLAKGQNGLSNLIPASRFGP